MNGITTLAARARGAADARGGLARVLALALLAALVLPLLMSAFAPAAHAEEDERDNYSLYQLASNASTYFSEENSPEGGESPDDRMNGDWRAITANPGTGGGMLGYADPEFSLFNVVGWLFAEATGSTQTISYDTLKGTGGSDETDVYSGMIDYAHFGAANADLGLDTMSSGIGGQIISLIGGGIMWLLYALALAVGALFYLIIQLLKMLNPFMWFYQAVAGVADASGNTNSSHQQELADGMVCSTDPTTMAETCHTGGGALAGLQHWISSWYGLLQSIAWEALVPLFIGFLLIGLVLFKKMDRGSAIKKLIVRVVFIGVGLPLLGSMYTGVLDKFDDSLVGQHAGPTRVVLSTYVDFEAWMMNDRLGIPDGALIAWDNGQASNDSMMSVRTTALAINKQSHGSTFADLNVGNRATDAEEAWKNSMVGMEGSASEDFSAVAATFGILNNYISGNKTAASDFESGIKSSITNLGVGNDVKKEWFVDEKGYGDSDKFGEETDYVPTNHPVLAISGEGLTSSNPGGNSTTFTTQGTKHGCGFRVWADDAPVSCNMSALSAYNYLNTGFGPESMTMYSSNNVTSGLTREDHMAVSQVGTGPAKFMYWHNAGTVLGSIVLLGFWYAIGMLVGAVKRTFSLVAAIPFATLGAVAAISKVIVYSVALILEVIVTLFIYQFVSELLISIPDIIAGPVSSFMSQDGLWGSSLLGGIIVVILTLISSLLVMGITFALLRVRKVVLQAMDEVFTKLVDKFLDTNTAPKPDKSGMLPALAAGAGAGAGMAMGNKLASGVGSKLGGGSKSPKSGGNPGGSKNASTNAGGLNGDAKALSAGKGALALDGGKGPDDAPSGGGNDGPPPPPGGGGFSDVRALPTGSGAEGPAGSNGGSDGDKGGPLQLTSGKPGSSRSDKETAQILNSKGGLSNLGYSTGDQQGAGGGRNGQPAQGGGQPGTDVRGGRGSSPRGGDVTGGQTSFGVGGAQGAPGTKQLGQSGGQNGVGQSGSESTERTSGGRKAIAGQSSSTQFGIGQQGAPASSGQDGQPQNGARFAAGTSGPAQLNPGRAGVPASAGAQGTPGTPSAQGGAPVPGAPVVPGTKATRAAQGQQPAGQAGAGSRPTQASGGKAPQGNGQNPKFSAGTRRTGGAAELNPGRAGTPAVSGAPAAPTQQSGASAPGVQPSNGSRTARPVQGQTAPAQAIPGQIVPGQAAQSPRPTGTVPAAGAQGRPQAGAQRRQAQVPGTAQAPAQGGRRAATRPAQQAQPAPNPGQQPQAKVQGPTQASAAGQQGRRPTSGPATQPQPRTAGQRPQQGQRREQVDRSVASGSTKRPSVPQPTTGSSAPASAPAKGSSASERKAPTRQSKAPTSTTESGQQQQTPAKPRRAADPAPKRTDGPVSQRKPKDKPKS